MTRENLLIKLQNLGIPIGSDETASNLSYQEVDRLTAQVYYQGWYDVFDNPKSTPVGIGTVSPEDRVNVARDWAKQPYAKGVFDFQGEIQNLLNSTYIPYNP